MFKPIQSHYTSKSPKSPNRKKKSHSRESGNLPESLIVFWHRAPKQLEVGEIPAFAGMEREGKGGKADGKKKSIPFRRKPESHSRVSENFPRSGTLQWSPVGECGFAAEIPAFAGMEVFFTSRLFFTPRRLRGGCERKAVAGGGELAMMFGVSPPPKNSLARIFTPPPQAAEGGISCREIPAFAGMEKGAGMEERGREWKEEREWRKGAGMGKGTGMEKRGGNGERKAGMEYIFYPPPLAGGGASAKRSRGVESWR